MEAGCERAAMSVPEHAWPHTGEHAIDAHFDARRSRRRRRLNDCVPAVGGLRRGLDQRRATVGHRDRHAGVRSQRAVGPTRRDVNRNQGVTVRDGVPGRGLRRDDRSDTPGPVRYVLLVLRVLRASATQWLATESAAERARPTPIVRAAAMAATSRAFLELGRSHWALSAAKRTGAYGRAVASRARLATNVLARDFTEPLMIGICMAADRRAPAGPLIQLAPTRSRQSGTSVLAPITITP